MGAFYQQSRTIGVRETFSWLLGNREREESAGTGPSTAALGMQLVCLSGRTRPIFPTAIVTANTANLLIA